MKKMLFLIVFLGIVCFSGFSQTTVTARLVEFRIRELNFTSEISPDVKVTTSVKNGIKYLKIELTPLGNSIVFSGNTFGYDLFNDSNSSVTWRTSVGGNYIQISDYIFIETTSNGKKLYLVEEGINNGSYNSNVLILLLPNNFNL